MKPRPTFREEAKLWKIGFDFVIGVDEVGRGAFAGPVTVGAVVFDRLKPYPKSILGEINDSKLLNPQIRQKLSIEIKKHALYCTTASIGLGRINRQGIGKATEMAFRKVLQKAITILRYKDTKNANKESLDILISKYPNIFVLIDGFQVKYLYGVGLKNQQAIIKGDQKSISIAAASIIAKVHRDNFMISLHRQFPVYNFAKNKGYGTKEHQLAIKKHGLAKVHRLSFALEKFTPPLAGFTASK